MSISCQLRYCKALLVTNLTRVSSAISSTGLYLYLFTTKTNCTVSKYSLRLVSLMCAAPTPAPGRPAVSRRCAGGGGGCGGAGPVCVCIKLLLLLLLLGTWSASPALDLDLLHDVTSSTFIGADVAPVVNLTCTTQTAISRICFVNNHLPRAVFGSVAA